MIGAASARGRRVGSTAALALLVMTVPACSRSGARGHDAGVAASAPPSAPEPRTAGFELPPPRQPAVAPGRRHELPALVGAQRVAAITRDGHHLIVAGGVGWLSLIDGEGRVVERSPERPDGAGAPQPAGGVQLLEAIDVDGDGAEEIVVGRGRARAARDAAASLTIYRPGKLGAGESIPVPASPRAELIGAAVDPSRSGRLYFGAFDSKYMVTLYVASRTAAGWQVDEVNRLRMAWGLVATPVDRDDRVDLVVARLYGDRRETDGDVLWLGPEGQRRPLPSTRGARAITAASEGGVRYLIYSDGWDRRYRAEALGLVTRASFRDGAWRRDTLANVKGRFSFDRLRVGDVDGDGKHEVICAGNGPALRVPLAPAPERVARLGSEEAWDACPVDLDGDGADEVVVLGPTPGDLEHTRGWLWRSR